MQTDISRIIEPKIPIFKLVHSRDKPKLYYSMIGVVLKEVIRLMPPAIQIPKITNGDQVVVLDGKSFTIPDRTSMQLNTPSTKRNLRYWPMSPNGFTPERWLPSQSSSSSSHEDVREVAARASCTIRPLPHPGHKRAHSCRFPKVLELVPGNDLFRLR